MHEAHPFHLRGIRKRRAELDPKPRRRPALLGLHIHDGLAFHLPINEALAKGRPVPRSENSQKSVMCPVPDLYK